MNKPLIVIAGPTAVGKTNLSIQLAKSIQGEIISADSMQIYRYMDIGTAKITKAEMEGIPHYLIDEINPDEEFSVALYKERAEYYIEKILSNNKIPILAGGTGFYINSVIDDLQFSQAEIDYEFRKELERQAQEYGNLFVHNQLKENDPISAERIHPNNLKRVIRAIEVFRQTGKPLSSHEILQKEKSLRYNLLYFGLTRDRSELYSRIDARVDLMTKQGLVGEVKSLLEKGYSSSLVSMQGLGYKEIISYLEGDISLDEAIYILKRDTRHYAKRQLTWFRRDQRIHWLNLDEYSHINQAVEKILKTIEGHGII